MSVMGSLKSLMGASQAALPAGTTVREVSYKTLNQDYLRILATYAPGRNRMFLPAPVSGLIEG